MTPWRDVLDNSTARAGMPYALAREASQDVIKVSTCTDARPRRRQLA